MVFGKVYMLPLLFGFWLPATVFITYTVSVLTNHVKPILPYISDTGTWAPESCIFGMMLTFGALLLLSIGYIRFRHVTDVQQKHNYPLSLQTLNKLGLYFGLTSVFGCLVVANFQVTQIFVVHIFGAITCFGFGFLFQIVQVMISFKTFPEIGNKKINILRLFLNVITGVSFFITFIFAYLSINNFTGTDMTKWKVEDGGYNYHLASVIGEYILVAATIAHIVTYIEEFRTIEIQQPIIGTKENITQ